MPTSPHSLCTDGSISDGLDESDFDYVLYGEPKKNEIEMLVDRYRISSCEKDKTRIIEEIIEKYGFKVV